MNVLKQAGLEYIETHEGFDVLYKPATGQYFAEASMKDGCAVRDVALEPTMSLERMRLRVRAWWVDHRRSKS